MSLVGSLEDLGLGDILQIITLSRKSGALLLRADAQEGRLIFRDGLVCGARVKDRTPDLRGLLVDGGQLSEDEFESVRGDSAGRGIALSAALAERITPERFEGLRRECVERAVLDMFGWETGEFSFEVGDDTPEDEFEVVLEAGINAQYLAMEGTRRTDEEGREPEVSPDDPFSFADVAEEIATAGSPRDAFEAVALTTAEKVEARDALDSTTEEEVEEALEAAIGASTTEPAGEAAAKEPARARPVPPPAKLPPIVVLAPELPVLEWVKRVLEGTFRRVHIFQKSELAVQRLRQYTVRSDWPLVLVSPSVDLDGSDGSRTPDGLIARMKKQSPPSTVLWLGEREDVGSAHGAVPCAAAQDAASPAGPLPELDDALREAVLGALGRPAKAVEAVERVEPAEPVQPREEAAEPDASAKPSERLARVRARLEDPETRGELLNVVLQFASDHFERVALFVVRDGEAEGLAGIGLDKAGGPCDEDLRSVRLAVADSRWLDRVAESRAALRAAPDGPGDHELSARLGEALAREAWLAPVISGGQVVAILYGDNLPGGDPLGESHELESVLEQAGKALEEAMEERARNAG